MDKYADVMIKDIREIDHSLETPSFLSGWEVESLVGRGSFGSVYCITKSSGGIKSKQSALKVIPVTDDKLENFLAEVELLQSLENYNIIRIEDFDLLNSQDGQRVYLLIRMEYLEPVPRRGNSIETVVKIGVQIGAALAACHRCNPPVIHRDVKPDNILKNHNGDYKLGDFGASRLMGECTMTNIGTPQYVSPEVATFQKYDVRADIYSLAVTLYTYLNDGKTPFIEHGTQEAIGMRLSGKPLPDIPGVPPRLMDVIRKGAAHDPNARYSTVTQFCSDLEASINASGAQSVYDDRTVAVGTKVEETRSIYSSSGQNPYYGNSGAYQNPAAQYSQQQYAPQPYAQPQYVQPQYTQQQYGQPIQISHPNGYGQYGYNGYDVPMRPRSYSYYDRRNMQPRIFSDEERGENAHLKSGSNQPEMVYYGPTSGSEQIDNDRFERYRRKFGGAPSYYGSQRNTTETRLFNDEERGENPHLRKRY